MSNKKNLEFEKRVVRRLIMQYQEYVLLMNMEKELEDKKLITAASLSKKNNSNVMNILRATHKYPQLKLLDDQLTIINRDLQQVSDEMTFANHIIWMMYKHKAYANTPKEIVTLQDFRKHCSPVGYICTKRYQFLKLYLQNKYLVDIENKKEFPDTMKLQKFYNISLILNLMEDTEFIKKWKSEEYLKTKGKVNKWHTMTTNTK